MTNTSTPNRFRRRAGIVLASAAAIGALVVPGVAWANGPLSQNSGPVAVQSDDIAKSPALAAGQCEGDAVGAAESDGVVHAITEEQAKAMGLTAQPSSAAEQGESTEASAAVAATTDGASVSATDGSGVSATDGSGASASIKC